MPFTSQLISTSITEALREFKVNKLRTFLSLLGITIGIFCIIAVLTVIDGMKSNIQKEVATLGSDVLYMNRWPWTGEGGEYKWWEFWRRPSMGVGELKAIQRSVPDAELVTLCLPLGGLTVKHLDEELEGLTAYSVMDNFDKIQNIEIASGRYLSQREIDGGTNAVVLGDEVYKNLFPGNTNAIGKAISFKGKRFITVGVMKRVGQNMAGFDFDNAVIFPYYAASAMVDVTSLNNDPFIVVKAGAGKSLEEVKYEVEGALRKQRKVKPGEPNDFAINQLSQISAQLDIVFSMVNLIGALIAFISLVVGGFGIANIMFVTVKERTKIIGLKKALGARKKSVLMEFLVEAVTLCLAGGLIGIVLVVILGLVSTYALDFPVALSFGNFILGISISAVVGILSGIIPAWSASRLDPVVAIRSQ
jgi:putative ABC transport system permease protein